MARIYKNHVHLYSGLQEFQEKAVRFLNEIYGREKPLDFIDFALDRENNMYVATGWYEGEDAPAEQQPGELLSADAQKVIAQPGGEPLVFLGFLKAPAQPKANKVNKAPAQDKAKVNGQRRK